MLLRSIRTEFEYFIYRQSHPAGCGYCIAYEQKTDQLVNVEGSMLILKARFPYAKWDGRKVQDHLLVVPARHTTALNSLTEEESHGLMNIMKSYEKNGYSFYIRAASNTARTMPHVHGHLIQGK